MNHYREIENILCEHSLISLEVKVFILNFFNEVSYWSPLSGGIIFGFAFNPTGKNFIQKNIQMHCVLEEKENDILSRMFKFPLIC